LNIIVFSIIEKISRVASLDFLTAISGEYQRSDCGFERIAEPI